MTSKKKNSQNPAIFPSEKNNLNGPYKWQLWLLKTSVNKSRKSHLLYSWVVPCPSGKAGWEPEVTELTESVKNTQGSLVKVELLRAAFIGSGQEVRNYTDALQAGKFLNEIENSASYPPPSFETLSLGENTSDVAGKYVVRPEVFLPVEHLLLPWSSRSVSSPSGYSIFVSQFYCLAKSSLLSFPGCDLNPQRTKKLIRKLSAQLERSTGFDISKSSAPRIGNMEWYRLPASNADLQSLIAFHSNQTGTTADVSFKALPASGHPRHVVVRCRLVNGEEVALDELREYTWSHSAGTVSFTFPQPLSNIQVTVWEKEPTSGRTTIIFEDSAACIRTMVINSSIIGSRIDSGKLNLLDKLVRQDEKNKPSELASFDRASASGTSRIGDHQDDPWVQAGRFTVNYMRQLFPEKSQGHFFLNGWDESKEASGQLSFVEWMLKIISGEGKGGLILIDPYFDQDGIELFAHARTTNTTFQILTCTQHREKDAVKAAAAPDAGPSTTASEQLQASTPNDKHTATAKTLQAACQSALPLISGLKLYVLDLRSANGGKAPLFHDRYLLLSDKAGKVTKGFHLSNSIQGATRKAPLLVTPIPADILPNVVAYVEGLTAPQQPVQSSRKTEIITLYPFKEKNDTQTPKPTVAASEGNSKLRDIPEAGTLFSRLLGEPSLETLRLPEVEAHLTQAGILSKEDGALLFYKLTPAQIHDFAHTLSLLPEPAFSQTFSAFGEFKARSHPFDHEAVRVAPEASPVQATYDAWEVFKNAAAAFPPIGEKIRRYLGSFTNSEQLIRDRDRLYAIYKSDTFAAGFEASLTQIRYMAGEVFTLDYGRLCACEVLMEKFPALAVRFLERLLEEAENGNWNEVQSRTRASMLLVSTLSGNLLEYSNRANVPLQAHFLASSHVCIRAAASATLISGVLQHPRHGDLDAVFNTLLGTLPDEEYRLAIAAMLAELQLQVKDAEQKQLQEDLLDRLLSAWSADEGLVYRVTEVLSGRLPSNNSLFITDHFLFPLLDRRVITPLQAFTVWQAAFLEKIKYRAKYKDNGSADMPYKFCATTDIELTRTMRRTMARLSPEEQLQGIQAWVAATAPCWSTIHQPFAQHTAYRRFHASAIRVYWVKFLLNAMMQHNMVHGAALTFSREFLQTHQQEFDRIDAFVDELNYSIAQLKEVE